MENIIINSYEIIANIKKTDESKSQILTNHNNRYPMKMFFALITTLFLVACGSDNSTPATSTSISAATSSASAITQENNTLMLSGVATEKLGTTLDFKYFTFRTVPGGDILFTTTHAYQHEFFLSTLSEPIVEELTPWPIDETKFSLAISHLGVEVHTFTPGFIANYTISCDALFPCSNMIIDKELRTVTFTDFSLTPVISPVSYAIAPLILNGTITWEIADEGIRNIGNVLEDLFQFKDYTNPYANLEPAVMSDLVGLWDGITIYDGNRTEEVYFKITEAGEFNYYDYQGDTHDEGDNCYFIDDTNVITDLGGGFFTIKGSLNLRAFIALTTTPVAGIIPTIYVNNDVYLNLVPTDLSIDDFIPICDLPPNTIIAQ